MHIYPTLTAGHGSVPMLEPNDPNHPSQLPSSDHSLSPSSTVKAISRAILYGSIATPIKKPETEHTHKWTVYVRGFNNEDISYYIRRVTFKLHESFVEPNRTVEKFPFEIHETGWGEFQIQIRIAFQDPAERPISLYHQLKLYPPEDTGQLKTSRSVVSEHYDEIVLPRDQMAKLLTEHEHLSDITKSPKYLELKQMEAVEIEKLHQIMDIVKKKIKETELLVEEKAHSTVAGTKSQTAIPSPSPDQPSSSKRTKIKQHK